MEKQGSPPVLNETVLKANIEAMSCNMANLVDPAAIVSVPKELDTSRSFTAVKEGTATVLLEPCGSHVSGMETVDHVNYLNPQAQRNQSPPQTALPMELLEWDC